MDDSDLVDVELEDALSRETLMSIDISRNRADTRTIGLYLTLLVATLAFAYLGPTTTVMVYETANVQSDPYHIGKYIYFPMDKISRLHQFVELSIQPFFTGDWKANPTLVNISCDTDIANDHAQGDYVGQNFKNVTFSPGDSLMVFRREVGFFTRFTARVAFISGDLDRLTKCDGSWTVGNWSFGCFIVGFRIFLSVLVLVCFVVFICRLRWSRASWHLEQKITVGLLLMAVVADIPVFGEIMQMVFSCIVKLYMLILVGAMKFKNRKITCWFFFPHIIVMVGYVTVKIWKLEDIGMIVYSTDVAFFVWFGLICAQAHCRVDPTEQGKFMTYMMFCLITVVGQAAVEWFNRRRPVLNYNFVGSISMANFFAISMTIYHWPYEVMADQYRDLNDAEA